MTNKKRNMLLAQAALITSLGLSGCGFSPQFSTSDDIKEGHVRQEKAESEAESEALAKMIAESESESEALALLQAQAEEAERIETFLVNVSEDLTRLRAQYGQDFVFPMKEPVTEAPVLSYLDYYMLPYYFLPLPAQPEEHTLDNLKLKLEDMTADYSGNWSVYLKDLTNDESIIINDTAMASASVMKLFVLGTVYKAFSDGTLERTSDTVSLMSSMITASSNEATNRLLLLLGDGSYAEGIAKVNDYIETSGYSSMTHEYNGFQDEATIMDPDHFNQVGAKDLGALLESVYHRTFGTREVCNEVESWMLSQETRYKIPAGLPDGVSVGNKTGETDDTENDAAVIYSDKCDYVLVVLSGKWDSKSGAQRHIQEISETVYDYLCGDTDADMVLRFPVAPQMAQQPALMQTEKDNN